MRFAIRCASLVLAAAAGTVDAQSALLGKRLVAKGDEVGKVREAGGEPDRIDRIAADDTSPAMEIWTYTRKGRVITVWIVSGRVVQVEDRRAEDGAKPH